MSNKTDMQTMTPDEYINYVDPNSDMSDIERGYLCERFVHTNLTRQIQEKLGGLVVVINDCLGTFQFDTADFERLGKIGQIISEIEQLIIKVDEQAQIIDSVLVKPNEEDVH